ncbi:MAG: hypothetical protein KGD57_02000, partial [Candidatus Lokiarchaeota archaeon]|nr:hypothetical protein [Candidatus Lokiarchaeota archaeon]
MNKWNKRFIRYMKEHQAINLIYYNKNSSKIPSIFCNFIKNKYFLNSKAINLKFLFYDIDLYFKIKRLVENYGYSYSSFALVELKNFIDNDYKIYILFDYLKTLFAHNFYFVFEILHTIICPYLNYDFNLFSQRFC